MENNILNARMGKSGTKIIPVFKLQILRCLSTGPVFIFILFCNYRIQKFQHRTPDHLEKQLLIMDKKW